MVDNIDLVKRIEHYKNVKKELEARIEKLKAQLSEHQKELEVATHRVEEAEKNLRSNKSER